MASSLHQWESDPLFPAAEVVHDSADRMESLFRLLLHDQNLVQAEQPYPRLLASIEYHKRDLATILETAKWQLEDFERAVNLSAMQDKSRTREDVVSKHRQFIRAIRGQIEHVEKSMDGPSIRDSLKHSKLVNLNEQDRDGLALFLTGGWNTEHLNHIYMEDNSILRRFLDPNSTSSLKDDELVEHGNIELEKLKMNGDMHANSLKMKGDMHANYRSLKDGYQRNLGSHYTTTADSDLEKISGDREGESAHWDLEANEAIPESILHENKFRGFYSRMNFQFLNNLWTVFGNRITKSSYIKSLKDGEEQRHSPKYIDGARSAQSQPLGPRLRSSCRSLGGLYSRFQGNLMVLFSRLEARYQRIPSQIPIHRHMMRVIFTMFFALVVLGTVARKIA